MLASAWEYAVGDIPTQYLRDCFIRALRAKRDSYPLSGVDLNIQWETLKVEVARAGANNELRLLLESHKSGKLLTFSEWKQAHSPDNPRHSADKCPKCLERRREGKPPIHALNFGAMYHPPEDGLSKEQMDEEAAKVWAEWKQFRAQQDAQATEAFGVGDEEAEDDIEF